MPDEKKGRGLSLTPPPVKEWAEAHGIPVLQPVVFTDEIIDTLKKAGFDVFIVVAYGKILNKEVLDIPAPRLSQCPPFSPSTPARALPHPLRNTE